MVTHDLRCAGCGRIFYDVMIPCVDDVREGRYKCGRCGTGVLLILWLKPPAVNGVEKGSTWFRPGYNVQLGRSFASLDEHNKYVKEKGLQVIGPDEWRHGENTAHEPEEKWDHGAFVEAAKRGWEDTVEHGQNYSIPKVDRGDTVVVDTTTGRET